MIRYRNTIIMLVLAFALGCQFDGAGIGATGDGTDAAAGTADAPPCSTLDCGFARRRLVTVDVSRIDTELRDIPVFIALDNTRIDYAQTQPDGEDLRFFTAELEMELDYEIESWEPTGSSSVWLKIPALVPDQDVLQLWMYYGNPDAPASANPTAVWSNEFVSVHHLAGDFADSASPGHDGVASGSPGAIAGLFGPAYDFDGNNDYIELPDEAAYDFTEEMSASIWFKVGNFTRDWQALLTKGDHSWRIHRHGGSDQLAFSTTRDNGDHHNEVGTRDVVDDRWHHVLVTYDGSRKSMYIDGQMDADGSYDRTLNDTPAPVFIGQNSDRRDRYFLGGLDEARVARVSRPAAWAQVEYLSVVDDKFIVIGPEETM